MRCITLITLGLLGCGVGGVTTIPGSRISGEVPVELLGYVLDFQAEADARGRGLPEISVEFSQLSDPLLGGVCIHTWTTATRRHEARETRRVVISTDWWPRLGELQRTFLMRHELGHCYLGLEHAEEGWMRAVTPREDELQAEMTEEVRGDWDQLMFGGG